MKKTRISESQIASAIKAHESGKSTADICRELGVHQATFYNWKKKIFGHGQPGATQVEGA